jgi:hypothetical protein
VNELLCFFLGTVAGCLSMIAAIYQLVSRMPGMAHALIDRYGGKP